jgi:hypothetical protein
VVVLVKLAVLFVGLAVLHSLCLTGFNIKIKLTKLVSERQC